MVGREAIEPPTIRLKVRRSDAETPLVLSYLASRQERLGTLCAHPHEPKAA